MNCKIKLGIILLAFIMLASITGCRSKSTEEQGAIETTRESKTGIRPMILQIIIASVRHTSTGEKIAKNIKAMADKRQEIQTELVYIKDYNLPFYTQEVAPSLRQGDITDPILRKWSDKIKKADGYIIIAPEYNAGYPGPLKNALDSLYKEWNNKPIAFVGYSGGPSGGASMITQLRHVTAQGLGMIPVAADITIGQSWKAFNENGGLIKPGIEQQLNIIIDQLLEARNTAHKH